MSQFSQEAAECYRAVLDSGLYSYKQSCDCHGHWFESLTDSHWLLVNKMGDRIAATSVPSEDGDINVHVLLDIPVYLPDRAGFADYFLAMLPEALPASRAAGTTYILDYRKAPCYEPENRQAGPQYFFASDAGKGSIRLHPVTTLWAVPPYWKSRKPDPATWQDSHLQVAETLAAPGIPPNRLFLLFGPN